MPDINLKTLTPDTSLPKTGFLFGADSQAATDPSVYTTQSVATTLLGSTSLTGDVLTADAPVLNLTQTWDNNAVTFTGIRYNVTNTNSAAASLLMDLQVGGVSQFKVEKSGGFNFYSGAGVSTIQTNNTVLGITSQFGTRFSSTSARIAWPDSGGNPDLNLSRRGAANLRFGDQDAASPIPQTLSVQSIVGGGGTPNLSAAAYPFKITGAQGTGQGAGGSIIFQTAPAAVSSGNGQNGLTDALTIDSVGSVQIVRALTVATLPGTPLAGMIARVSDANTPVIGMTVAGSGAAYALVNYNGSNWTVIGV
jgi:hypothetical protein